MHKRNHSERLVADDIWDIETDIVVVGFGAAGASAAIGAAANGAKVILLESACGSGGVTGVSAGEIYMGGGTPVQRANGFEDDVEEFYKFMMMAGGVDADEAKTRLYVDNCLSHYEWLVSLGVPYKGTYRPGKIFGPDTDDTLLWTGSEAAWPFSQKSVPAPRGHLTQSLGGAGGGRMLLDVLEARVMDLDVDVRFSARVLRLVLDENDGICGVVARINGVEQRVRAKSGIILCTGGFSMNEAMIQRYAPGAVGLEPLGEPQDGSGILMGMSAGADAIHMDEFFATCPWYPPESLVKGIIIDERGNRFINEDCYHGRVISRMLRQPGDRFYLLVDNATFGRPLEFARIDLAAVGDTWEEVEAELQMTTGALTRTVDIYNRHAEAGEDPLWHKAVEWLKPLNEGPFAALEIRKGSSLIGFFTLGGLNTSTDGEVLTIDGVPIPGLYAAGRTTSGLPRTAEGYASGMSLADCTFFGRRAGWAAAQTRVPNDRSQASGRV